MDSKLDLGAHEAPPCRSRDTDVAVRTPGFALHVAEKTNAYAATAAVSDFAKLCDQAADHLALAHNLLVTHESHTDTAIGHLDAALDCLQRVSADGQRPECDEQIGRELDAQTRPGPCVELTT